MRKVSKYEVFSGLYFPLFGLNTRKYGPKKPAAFVLVSRSESEEKFE